MKYSKKHITLIMFSIIILFITGCSNSGSNKSFYSSSLFENSNISSSIEYSEQSSTVSEDLSGIDTLSSTNSISNSISNSKTNSIKTSSNVSSSTISGNETSYYPDYPEGKYDDNTTAPLIKDLFGKQLFNSVFENTKVTVSQDAKLNLTTDIKSFDNSKWYSKWDEKDVFRLQLKHEGTNPYTLRIGKGGQIYSIETPIGEIMPPQNVEHAWIDDTTTITVQQYDQNMVQPGSGNLYQFTGFIHQAGMYQHKDPLFLGDKSFFSPIVAEYWDSSNNAYNALTLGMISSGPAYNRADVLIYSRIRDIGNGIIEADYMIYNYNTIMPMTEKEKYTTDFSIWGGVRRSKLPSMLIQLDDGEIFESKANFGSGGLFDSPDFGNYQAATQNAKDNNSYTFAWVNSNKKANSNQSLFFSLGNANRDDYNVMSFTYRDKIPPGTSYRMKMYYVLGPLGEIKKIGTELGNNTPHGFVEFKQDSSKTIPLFLRNENGQTILADRGTLKTDKPAMFVYAQPVKDSKPLYLIKNMKTNQYNATCDPYMLMDRVPIPGDTLKRLGYRPYDGTTKIIKILGFVMPNEKIQSNLGYKRLDSILTDTTYYTKKGVYDQSIMVRTTPNK